MADLGFPVGGHGPMTWVLLAKNVCENVRIGPRRGCVPGTPLDPPMMYLSNCKSWLSFFHRTKPLVSQYILQLKTDHPTVRGDFDRLTDLYGLFSQ